MCAAFWPCLDSSLPGGLLRPITEEDKAGLKVVCSVVCQLAAGLLGICRNSLIQSGCLVRVHPGDMPLKSVPLQVMPDVQRPPVVPSSSARAQQLPPTSSQDFASRFRCKCPCMSSCMSCQTCARRVLQRLLPLLRHPSLLQAMFTMSPAPGDLTGCLCFHCTRRFLHTRGNRRP